MNRDEAVKKIAKEGYISIEHAEELYDSIVPKPVVPQYVADWYEEHNDGFEDFLSQCIYDVGSKYTEEIFDKFEKWLINNEQALTTLINMHQFGYEVEEETEYEVKLKKTPQILYYDEKNKQYYFSMYITIFSREYHTRKQLEDGGFDWVFDCEGVEIEEVK